MILNGGMSNLATMEKWMGEIIDIESQSIAYFSTLVRNAVDRLTRRIFTIIRIFIYTTNQR